MIGEQDMSTFFITIDQAKIDLPNSVRTWRCATQYVKTHYADNGIVKLYLHKRECRQIDTNVTKTILTLKRFFHGVHKPFTTRKFEPYTKYDSSLIWFKVDKNGVYSHEVLNIECGDYLDIDDVSDDCLLRKCLRLWYTLSNKERMVLDGEYVDSPLALWAMQVIIRDRNMR